MIEIQVLTNHSGGNVIDLALSEGAELRASKRLGGTDDIQTVTREIALSTALPDIPENRLLLLGEAPGHDSAHRGKLKRIIARAGGSQVGLTLLRFDGRDRAADTINVTLLGNAWAEEVEALTTDDLRPYFDDLIFDRPTVEGLWDTPTAPVQAIPGYYGTFATNPANGSEAAQYTLADTRIWFNRAHLLKAIFAAAGYAFQSSYYLGTPQNQRYDYLSGENWFSYTTKQHPAFARVNIPTAQNDRPGAVRLIYFTDVEDPANAYEDTPNGNFPPAYGHYELKTPNNETSRLIIAGTLTADLPAHTAAHGLAVYVSLQTENDTTFPRGDVAYLPDEGAGTVTIEFSFTLDDVPRGSLIGIYSAHVDTDYQTLDDYDLTGGEVTFRPDTPTLIEGNTIPPMDLLDTDINWLDYVKGCAHETNGQFVFDAIARTVELLPAKKEGKADGFYLDNPHDLREDCVLDTLKYTAQTNRLSRKHEYGYAKPSGHIKAENLYGTTIDLGTGAVKTATHRNGFFEPTRSTIRRGGYVVNYYESEGELAGALGYRTAHYYGRVPQSQTGQSLGIVWYGQTLAETPTLAQVLGIEVGTEPVNATYEGNEGFYQRFYRDLLLRQQIGDRGEVVIAGGQEIYDLIDFRNYLLIQDRDRTYRLYPTEVADHPLGTRTPVLVKGWIA